MSPISDSNTLDISRVGGIDHHTEVKVVTGAVVVTYSIPGGSSTSGLLQAMDEPREQTTAQPRAINVLHLLHPLEWVAGAYGGGQTTLYFYESWNKTPYQEIGFRDAKEFVDIVNHEPFIISNITYKPKSLGGGTNVSKLLGCRVLNPGMAQGKIARDTVERMIPFQIGYTRLMRSGFSGG